MIKTILAIVEGPVHGGSFVDAVLAFAEYRQAHAIFDVLTAAPMLSPDLAPFGTLYTLSGELRQLVRDHASSLRALLPPESAAEIVSQCDDVGWIPGDLRDSAPLADLVIVGPHETWAIDWLRRRTIETVLMASGTPLLLLPPGRSVRMVGHAVLGWKPGPTAMRALQQLVRLATPGARIDVVAVKHELGDQPETVLEPVLALLRRHGFGVEGHALDRNGKPQDVLTSFALDRGADLLVVGGFAHSRVREIVLGGVTRSLIDDPRLPVLMAH